MLASMNNKLLGTFLSLPEKANERGIIRFLYCTLNGDCPFLTRNQCIHQGFGQCIYGKWNSEKSPTRRSKAYFQWQKNAKNTCSQPLPHYADKHIAVIGDYLYLPYAHMDLCEQVKFKRHSVLVFGGGIPFVHKDEFGAEQIVLLSLFRPHALMGGEITNYQKHEIPIFLFHLKHMFSELYREAAALEPTILSKTFDPVSLKTLKVKLSEIESIEDCTIAGNSIASWDGEWLEFETQFSSLGFFVCGGDLAGNECRIRIKANAEKTKVVVNRPDQIVKIVEKRPYLIDSSLIKH